MASKNTGKKTPAKSAAPKAEVINEALSKVSPAPKAKPAPKPTPTPAIEQDPAPVPQLATKAPYVQPAWWEGTVQAFRRDRYSK